MLGGLGINPHPRRDQSLHGSKRGPSWSLVAVYWRAALGEGVGGCVDTSGQAPAGPIYNGLAAHLTCDTHTRPVSAPLLLLAVLVKPPPHSSPPYSDCFSPTLCSCILASSSTPPPASVYSCVLCFLPGVSPRPSGVTGYTRRSWSDRSGPHP